MTTCIHIMRHQFLRTLPIALPLLVVYCLSTTKNSSLRNLSLSPQFIPTESRSPPSQEVAADSNQTETIVREESQTVKHTIPGSRLTQALPECARNDGKAKTFLFVFMGHSGSTAMLSELRSHPEVFVDLPEPVDHGEYMHNTTLALKFTRDFFEKAIELGKTGGFKIRPMHIHKKPGEWAALARKYDTRIIWQYRNNVLKQAVGEYSNKHLKDKASVEGLRSAEEVQNRCNTGVGCSFKIDNFDVFHRILKDCIHSDVTISRAVNLIANGSSCVHALPYEDYLYERETVMRNLQEFLGLKYAPTEPSRYKATRDNLCDVVTNWKELCNNFYGCHVWRHMFDDMRNECSCEFSSGHVKYCDTHYTG